MQLGDFSFIKNVIIQLAGIIPNVLLFEKYIIKKIKEDDTRDRAIAEALVVISIAFLPLGIMFEILSETFGLTPKIHVICYSLVFFGFFIASVYCFVYSIFKKNKTN